MPGDFSMCLCVNPAPTHHLRLHAAKSLRPCLAPSPRLPVPRKKGVVFADAVGLALTTVRHFSCPFYDEDPLGFAMASLRALRPIYNSIFILDFHPPGEDYTSFRARLTRQQVCLEQCAVQGPAVAGTVRVRNIGFEKRVTLRVSYNNWKSHYDLPCSYLRDPCGGEETDTFSFRLPLLLVTKMAEFCICFWCQGAEHWDNNEGRNYVVRREEDRHSFIEINLW
ncbi:protein phosphatase 1 regulatory subunit 3C-like [Anomaloglossus baeobatrachus]|uniref:protein phosphatase 1 regulatory subunit 3C-like n=1 Tax=Anomaloglossus baeobatrachus TaxID=238106 RepID=UPI003F4F88A8